MTFQVTKFNQKKTSREQSLKNSDGTFKEEVKLDYVKTFVMLGCNARAACRATGISNDIVNRWKKQEWWKDALHELKLQENIELSSRLKSIVGKSLAIVEDRLDKGDYFFNPTSGKVERKEVSIRDAHAVFKDSFQQKQILERAPEELMAAETIQEKLSLLAKQFEQFASQQKKPTITVTDVVFSEEKVDEKNKGEE